MKFVFQLLQVDLLSVNINCLVNFFIQILNSLTVFFFFLPMQLRGMILSAQNQVMFQGIMQKNQNSLLFLKQ